MDFNDEELDIVAEQTPANGHPKATKPTQFRVTAGHPAFGTCVFIYEAESRNAAFARFKSIVFNYRQWRIVSNEEETA